jgi:hypothetical protein
MKSHFRTFAIVLAAGASLGLSSACQAVAADRGPGPESTPGISSPQQANNHVSAHVEAHVNASGERGRATQATTALKEDEKREAQRDWRNTSGMERPGWTPTAAPFGWSRGSSR